MTDDQSLQPSQEGDLACMMLPLVNRSALLPAETVVELAPLKPFDMIHSTPDWFLGFYDWRGTRVPIISLETINDIGSPKISVGGSVAILHNTGIDERIRFLSIITQPTAKGTHIVEADIEEDTSLEKYEYDLMNVKANGSHFVIPDIEALERAVLDLNVLKDRYLD